MFPVSESESAAPVKPASDAVAVLLLSLPLPWIPPQVCAGDTERSGRKILKDYQNGALGAFCLEQPPRPGEGGGEKDYRLLRKSFNVN